MQIDLTEVAQTLGCKQLADGSWVRSPYIRFSNREAPQHILGLLKLRHYEIAGDDAKTMAKADIDHLRESAFFVKLTLEQALGEGNDEAIKLIKKAHDAISLAQAAMTAAVKMFE